MSGISFPRPTMVVSAPKRKLRLPQTVLETIACSNGTSRACEYVWGPDLSGSFQGAGGIGGLLAVSVDGQYYFPFYDQIGNVLGYVSEDGAVAAAYDYDAFGNILSSSGPMASFFRHRFSTKLLDPDTGLYYYGYRWYSPALGRWLSRDPIEEEGGENLYAFCGNDSARETDVLGMHRYITWFDFLGIGGSGETHLHVGLAVDRWKCKNGKWIPDGISTFDFHPKYSILNIVLAATFSAPGEISERNGLYVNNPITFHSKPEEDIMMLDMIREEMKNPPRYHGALFNCITWSILALHYGL